MITNAAASIVAPVEPATFAARVRVAHRTFGTGVVQSVDGYKLEIKFATSASSGSSIATLCVTDAGECRRAQAVEGHVESMGWLSS